MTQRLQAPDRVSEMDMLKLEWKQRKSEEGAMLNECIALHTSLDSKGDGEMRKGAELVAPLPSFSSVAEATRHVADTTTTANGQDSVSRHDFSVRFPMRTIWQICRSGDISIHDAPSGTKLHTLRRLKGDVRPSIVRHVPHCSVIPLVDGKTPAIVYGSPVARFRALEKQLLATPTLRVCDVDFVWIGFVDGSIRLVSSDGYPRSSTNHGSRMQKKESDYFLVHELSKCHSSEIVAVELSPYHTSREFPRTDLREHTHNATRGTPTPSLTELKHILVASDIQSHDRHVSYVCTASTDSCVVVWDLVEVYTAVNKLMESQRELERASQRGMKVGAKGPRFPSDHVRGCTRGTAAIYFETHQFTEPESMTLVSYCTQVSVRPVMKLKGSVTGLRHLRWVSTVVTTEGYKFHRFFDRDDAADVNAKGTDDADGGLAASEMADPLNPFTPDFEERHALSGMRQAQTRQDIRALRMLELGLSEGDMLAAESELQGKRFPVEKEPVMAKCVHLLIAGDSSGYVMLWNLDEELHRCTSLAPPTPDELSLHVARRGNSPTRRDADVRSLASHKTSTSHYLRATDKRIQFSGGVSISGIEPSLPPVVHITTRRAEPNHRAGRVVYNATGQELVDDPMVNEFMPLTDALALFHTYEHLELFVAVDGAVQFLSCHPAFLSLESEEQIHLLMDQRRRNLIEAKRGVDDEVVGSLEFQGFSVFFSKRVLEYHSQPITAMRFDAEHRELWVARHDGMMSCFSTTGLKVIARIPHPHSSATIAPPSMTEVDEGLADYHFLAGLPTHLDVHKECSHLPPSYLTTMVPTDTEKDPLLLCFFGAGDNSRAISQWELLSTCSPRVCLSLQRSVEVLHKRLAVAWTFQRRRAADRRKERGEARQACRAAERLLGIVRSASCTRSTTVARFRCLMRWSLFVRHRRTARAADHWYQLDNGAAQRKRQYMEQLYTAATQDRNSRKQQRNELASTLASKNERLVLYSGLTRWMQHSACHSPAKKAAMASRRSCEQRLQLRYLLQWQEFLRRARRSLRDAHVNTRFQLHQPILALRDFGLQALLRWKLWAASRGERMRIRLRNQLRCTAVTDACVAGVTRMRCFSKWRRFVSLRRLDRQLTCQATQLSECTLTQKLHLAVNVQQERRQDAGEGVPPTHAFNGIRHLIENFDNAVGERLLAEHFVEGSALLTSCFSASVVDPDDTTGLSLYDVMHAPTDSLPESTLPFSVALSRVTSEVATLQAAEVERSASLLATEAELRFVEQSASCEMLDVLDTFALVAAKCAAWQQGQSVEQVFEAAEPHRESLHAFLAEHGISPEIEERDDIESAAVTVLNGFVAPLLEAQNSSSDAAAATWEAVTVAFDFLRSLEILEVPGYYFSLAAALTERVSQLGRFQRAIRDPDDQPLSAGH